MELQSQQSKTELIELGEIVAPQGIKGKIRVYRTSNLADKLEEGGEFWLQCPQTSQPEVVELLSAQWLPGKNLYIVQLTGVEDRNQAESLRGCKILAAKSDVPLPSEDDYYISDLIDLEVYNQLTGENLGTISAVFWAGNDVLEVTLHQQPRKEAKPQGDPSKITRKSKQRKKRAKPPQPATVLIPFVKDIVPVVDLVDRRVEITPPPGLLELNQ